MLLVICILAPCSETNLSLPGIKIMDLTLGPLIQPGLYSCTVTLRNISLLCTVYGKVYICLFVFLCLLLYLYCKTVINKTIFKKAGGGVNVSLDPKECFLLLLIICHFVV